MAVKKAAMKKKPTVKKKAAVSTGKKVATAKQKSVAKKAPVKKKSVKKASTQTTKKKTVSKKKAAPKKTSAAAKKKITPKVKKKSVTKASATKKKTTASKKTPVRASTKKKVTTKAATAKKAAPKKKTVTRTSTVKKAAPKKKITTKKAVTKKPAAKKVKAKRLIPEEPMIGTSLPVEGIDPYMPSAGEIYMSEDQHKHFRHILVEWKKQLMQEADRTVDHMKSDAANYADPADRATQEEEFSLELRTRDRERKLIKKIDESLVTIDTEDYGYCESCGIEIGIRRLEARPTATLCIDCKTLQEIKEKQIYK